MDKTRLLFATGNPNKVIEIKDLVKDLHYDIVSMGEIGFKEDIPETGLTLKENALLKAAYLHEKTNMNVIAEDTGLEVNALNGAPGVHTARFAGPQKDAIDNMKLLLSKLELKEDRRASFHTVFALILDGNAYTFDAYSEGEIAKEMIGEGGFGYDPVFIPDGHTRSFAQMSMQEKSALSHRSRAFNKLHEFLKTK